MSAGIVFQQMIIISILIVTGYILYKRKIFDDGASKNLSGLVVNVCNPALLVAGCFDRDPSITNHNVLVATVAGFAVYVILILASFVIPTVLRVEKKWKNHYALMCIFGNTGFIGIPLIQALLGSSALIYVVILNIYFNLVFYTWGYYLVGGETSGFSPKSLINVGNISMILAIVIFMCQPKLPTILVSSVTYMSNATTLLAMLVIGINLARSDLKKIFTQPRLYGLVLLRFLLVPVIVAFVLRLFVKDEMLYGVMVILTAVPVANMPLMRVEETGGDGSVISQGIILTTIFSVLTVPLVAFVL
jgi:hypothetical protein